MESFLRIPPSSDFPLSNLPWGAVLTPTSPTPTLAVALGDSVIDVGALARAGLLAPGGPLGDGRSLMEPTLNSFLELGPTAWADARASLTRLLSSGEGRLRDDAVLREAAVLPATAVTHTLPITVSDYTDFYASRVHATTCGALFRGPEHALHPNWTRLPVGYGGRSSSIVASGTPIRRPVGQTAPQAEGGDPIVRPSAALDFELEVAAIIGAPPNPLGTRVAAADASSRIFGYTLLNDWSARDIQAWESTPLGPFNGKNFGSTLGAWIVTSEALAPFKTDAPPQDPEPPAYLDEGSGRHLYDVELTAELVTGRSGGGGGGGATHASTPITRSNLSHLYWTFPQMVAHHTLGGCVLRSGDVLGSGTVSAPGERGAACLLEATRRGAHPFPLSDGVSTRTWLQDGDEVVLRARCAPRDGVEGLGWGEARGQVVAAEWRS